MASKESEREHERAEGKASASVDKRNKWHFHHMKNFAEKLIPKSILNRRHRKDMKEPN